MKCSVVIVLAFLLNGCIIGKSTTISNEYPEFYSFSHNNKKAAINAALEFLMQENLSVSTVDYEAGIVSSKDLTIKDRRTVELNGKLINSKAWFVCDCIYWEQEKSIESIDLRTSLSILVTDNKVTVKWINLKGSRTVTVTGSTVVQDRIVKSTGVFEKQLEAYIQAAVK
jgi:hypothetical protein